MIHSWWKEDIHQTLDYYWMNELLHIINLVKNNPIQKDLYNLFYGNENIIHKKLYSLGNQCEYLTNANYNKRIEIEEVNRYTILRFTLDQTQSLKYKAKDCLENILYHNKVVLHDRPITLDDCVIVDVFDSKLTTFSAYHTDIEYSNFTGPAFNVWYLTENNESYGNMFLLETEEYKKEYTPCFLSDDYTDLIPVKRQSYTSILSNVYKDLGSLDPNKIKITYLNMKNGECLIMSKHLLHRTDLSRHNKFKGFNFRVILKNKDRSIDYKNKYTPIKPYHTYDEKHKKIYGCKLLDFV